MAYVLYRAAYTHEWASTWAGMFLVRRYAFTVSGIVVGFIFLAEVGFKRWRLLWLPLASLLLTYYFYEVTYWDFFW